MTDDRSQARREAATLLGVDVDHLSPADALRCDMIAALRLVIDAEQAAVLSGGQADLGKLNTAVTSLIALLPGRELPAPPPVDEPDPRTHMWETYLGMRRRGELADPTSTYEGRGRRIEELEAEIAALKAAGAPAPDVSAPDVPTLVETVAAPAGGNVGPLSRPPSPSAAAAPAPAAPPSKPFVNGLSDVPQHVRDTRPPNEAWRNFVKIDWQG